jgi:hypothetical protein
MKVLGIFGVIFSVVAASLALHLHFIYAKTVVLINQEIDAAISDRGLDYLQSAEYKTLFSAIEFESDYGVIVLLLGAISILMCMFPVLKKFHLAWVGVALGLFSFVIGAIYGTHMFS